MLVLSRKPGQKIHIGENVVIEVMRVHGHSVRIAIDAPREVNVRRGELRPDLKAAFQQAPAGKETP